jgi:AcrR family transcriptional regulator
MSPRTPAPATETRQRILDVATDLFRENGYAGTSIRDIADGLGMTKAALYYHFTCKDDVLDALVAPTIRAIEDFIAAAEAAPRREPADLLRQFVTILGCNAPILATALGDPVVMRAEAGRFRFHEKQARLVALIAGPDADEVRTLRAVAALGAVRAAMEHLAPRGCGAEDPLDAQRNVQRHLDTIVAAAVGALQS